MTARFAILIFSGFLLSVHLFADEEGNGVIRGRVFNASNNEPIPFANVVIWNTTTGASSDFDGNFLFTGIKPGMVEIRVSAVGFRTYVSGQLMVTNARTLYLEVPLEETTIDIDEVVVRASPFRMREESPVSMRRIGVSEIEKSPGGNRDISRVLQSFPGVASTPAFRNDLIVRGGGPSENRFFLDEVEIPNLNHFATQGASGGPVGIINVDFLREVEFYSGAFPANRGNALSSVLDMRQVDGNPERLQFRGAVGASDLALTMDGPLSPNTTFIFSARRSYLQFLFDVIGLPFLPTYNDFQFKSRTRIDERREFSVIGIGAIDQFRLNLNANETEEQRYILDYLPVNEQWNYAIGAVYKRYMDNSYNTWVLSRNYLNNSAYKYRDNNVDDVRTIDYESAEIENKFRFENTSRRFSNTKITSGLGFEYAKYTNKSMNTLFIGGQPVLIDYDSYLDLFKWNIFGQVSRDLLSDRLVLSLGVRADANSFSPEMSNLLDQISPRFSASYQITPDLSWNFNTGRFYQQPSYTTLGFRSNDGVLVNRENRITYMSADHLVSGFELRPDDASSISVEGFFKQYRNYPFSVVDSIPLASKGGDFGVFGDEEVTSTSEGRSYGMELLARSRDFYKFNVVLSYTFVRSEFMDLEGGYTPTAWDNRHIFNLTAQRSLPRNWDIGFKWRFVGGAPYTPFDADKSSLRAAWDAQNMPYPDLRRFNANRLGAFHQLDIRIDKQYFLSSWSLLLYLDVQNVYDFKSDEPDRISPLRDSNGRPLIDPSDQSRYLMQVIRSDGQGTILPTVGIIIEF
ncbi:MAG: TonB-dependent receptor [Marinilabiliales bacterium]|nr:MAG: TonB-dependent receptor [Marinilabiliales bacterium]